MKSIKFWCTSFIIMVSYGIFPVYAAGGGGQASSLDFLWKTVNFVVLVWILYYFAKKPFSETISNSSSLAQQTLNEARHVKDKFTTELQDFQQKLNDMEKEANAMVERAKGEAEAEKKRIIAEGEEMAANLVEQARFTIEQEYKKAEQDLKEWIADEAVKLAEVKLKSQVTATHQKELVQSYISELTS